MSPGSDVETKTAALRPRANVETAAAALPPRLNGLRALADHRAIWPLLALALILAVDGCISPGFFNIRIVEGRLFGNLIDILYRAMPTAVVALLTMVAISRTR